MAFLLHSDVIPEDRAIGAAGGGSAHNNIQPFLVLNFIIALQGIFPPRPYCVEVGRRQTTLRVGSLRRRQVAALRRAEAIQAFAREHVHDHPFTVEAVDYEASLPQLRMVRDAVFVQEQGVPLELEFSAHPDGQIYEEQVFEALRTINAAAQECASDAVTVTANATAEHKEIQVPALTINPAEYTVAMVANNSIVPLLLEHMNNKKKPVEERLNTGVPVIQLLGLLGESLAQIDVLDAGVVLDFLLLAVLGGAPPSGAKLILSLVRASRPAAGRGGRR